MTAVAPDIQRMQPEEGRRAIAGVLASGGVVVGPGEASYMAVADAEGAGGGVVTERLGGLNPDGLAAWLARDVEAIERAATHLSGAQRVMLHRLLPGPAVFRIEVDPANAEDVADRAGLPRSCVAPAGGETVLSVTCAAGALSPPEGAPARLCAEILDRRGGSVRTSGEATERVRGAGIASRLLVLEAGTAGHARPSTVIRLHRDPAPGGPGGAGWNIERAGSYERRFVEKQVVRTVLFVCTGNTCRSPMAEAIGRSWLSAHEPGVRTEVISAGLTAMPGMPVTAEAAEALRGLGIAAPTAGSRPLTRALLAEADAIFVMTRAHLDAVLSIDPTLRGKAKLLDPAGADVPDPIGMSQRVYTDTAERIRELIARRLQELDA